MSATMAVQATATTARGRAFWIGWTLSGLTIAFMVMDATMKLLALPVVLEASGALGFAGANMARGLGATLITCTILYALPRTAVLGAILLTGYLGGAVAAHLRMGSPLFTHILFGVYLGIMLWGGLYLRDQRLRALIPLRS
jgi:DoxX-like protein